MGSNSCFSTPIFLSLNIVFFAFLIGHATCAYQNSMTSPNSGLSPSSWTNPDSKLSPSSESSSSLAPNPVSEVSLAPKLDPGLSPSSKSRFDSAPSLDSRASSNSTSNPSSVPSPVSTPSTSEVPSPIPPPSPKPQPPTSKGPTPMPKPTASNATCSLPLTKLLVCRPMLDIRVTDPSFGMPISNSCCRLLRSLLHEEIPDCLCRGVKARILRSYFPIPIAINTQLGIPCGLSLPPRFLCA